MKHIKTLLAAFALTCTIYSPTQAATLDGVPDSEIKRTHVGYFYTISTEVPFDIEQQLKRAADLIDNDADYKLALAIIEEITKTDDKVVEAWVLGAICNEKMGQFREAEKYWKSALMIEPDNIAFYYYRGMNYLQSAAGYNYEYDNAIGQFKRALEINPNFIDAKVGIATAYELRGDSKYSREYDKLDSYEKALDIYNKLLVTLPNNGVILENKRIVQDKLNKVKEAQEERERKQEIANRIG